MPLSDAKIRTFKPEDRDRTVADCGDLYMLAKKTSPIFWRLKNRVHGKEELMVFGDYPHVGLTKARVLRDDAKSKGQRASILVKRRRSQSASWKRLT